MSRCSTGRVSALARLTAFTHGDRAFPAVTALQLIARQGKRMTTVLEFSGCYYGKHPVLSFEVVETLHCNGIEMGEQLSLKHQRQLAARSMYQSAHQEQGDVPCLVQGHVNRPRAGNQTWIPLDASKLPLAPGLMSAQTPYGQIQRLTWRYRTLYGDAASHLEIQHLMQCPLQLDLFFISV